MRSPCQRHHHIRADWPSSLVANLPNFLSNRACIHHAHSAQPPSRGDRGCELMPREPSTHSRLDHGMRERDRADFDHAHGMMRHRLCTRLAAERGFTLIEILVVAVLVGVLAAIALAVFLNQADKGRDASAK